MRQDHWIETRQGFDDVTSDWIDEEQAIRIERNLKANYVLKEIFKLNRTFMRSTSHQRNYHQSVLVMLRLSQAETVVRSK